MQLHIDPASERRARSPTQRESRHREHGASLGGRDSDLRRRPTLTVSELARELGVETRRSWSRLSRKVADPHRWSKATFKHVKKLPGIPTVVMSTQGYHDRRPGGLDRRISSSAWPGTPPRHRAPNPQDPQPSVG